MTEFELCKSNIVHFTNDTLYLDTHNGIIPFRLRPYQKNVLLRLHGRDYYIVSKSRQIGVTSVLLSLTLWECYFHDNQNILYLSRNAGTMDYVERKFTILHDRCSLSTKPTLKQNQKRLKGFSSGTTVFFKRFDDLRNMSSVRFNYVIIDEADYPDLDTMLDYIQGLITADCKIILASTIMNPGGEFQKIFMRALKGQNRFIPMELDWSLNKDWDENWRRHQDNAFASEKQASLSYDGILQLNDYLKTVTI